MGKLGWFVSDMNRNIPTAWKWARGDVYEMGRHVADADHSIQVSTVSVSLPRNCIIKRRQQKLSLEIRKQRRIGYEKGRRHGRWKAKDKCYGDSWSI